MFRIVLGSDDFHENSESVKVGNVAHAIARILLANGSGNKFQAERDAWPFIHTGIVEGKLHPLDPATLCLIQNDDYGNGVVSFEELVAWGKWCKRFDFVKQSAPDTKADEIKALQAKRQSRLERAIMPEGSGCAPRYRPPPITIRLPKWDYWRHMPTVEPWEACALALNIEPDSVDYRPESWDGKSESWRFPSDEIGDHFIKLLQLLNANQFEKRHFTENFAKGVRLSEFAAWCAPVVRDLICCDIPPELAALAKASPVEQVAPAAKVEAVTVAMPSGEVIPGSDNEDWIIKTWAIAQKIGMEKWNSGWRKISTRGIFEPVTTELALDKSTWVSQALGPRGSSNVRTVGLRGWQFYPPNEEKKVD